MPDRNTKTSDLVCWFEENLQHINNDHVKECLMSEFENILEMSLDDKEIDIMWEDSR